MGKAFKFRFSNLTKAKGKSVANIDLSIDYVFKNEGGYSDDPSDKGGMTNMGITQEDLTRWRGKAVSEADMQALTPMEAKRIYYFWWWQPLSLDQVFDQNVATAIFDAAVSLGVPSAVKCLQCVLNTVSAQKNAPLKPLVVDGVVGPLTLQTLNLGQPDAIITALSGTMHEAYESIAEHNPALDKFLDGWLSRADRLLTLTTTANPTQ
jgi:type VI secretion system secreted protein VgrG